MRIQDRHYTNELIVVQSYDVLDRSYTVSGTLHLVPSSDKSGQHFCCDVSNLFNSKAPQSVCLQLTINGMNYQINAVGMCYRAQTIFCNLMFHVIRT